MKASTERETQKERKREPPDHHHRVIRQFSILFFLYKQPFTSFTDRSSLLPDSASSYLFSMTENDTRKRPSAVNSFFDAGDCGNCLTCGSRAGNGDKTVAARGEMFGLKTGNYGIVPYIASV